MGGKKRRSRPHLKPANSFPPGTCPCPIHGYGSLIPINTGASSSAGLPVPPPHTCFTTNIGPAPRAPLPPPPPPKITDPSTDYSNFHQHIPSMAESAAAEILALSGVVGSNAPQIVRTVAAEMLALKSAVNAQNCKPYTKHAVEKLIRSKIRATHKPPKATASSNVAKKDNNNPGNVGIPYFTPIFGDDIPLSDLPTYKYADYLMMQGSWKRPSTKPFPPSLEKVLEPLCSNQLEMETLTIEIFRRFSTHYRSALDVVVSWAKSGDMKEQATLHSQFKDAYFVKGLIFHVVRVRHHLYNWKISIPSFLWLCVDTDPQKKKPKSETNATLAQQCFGNETSSRFVNWAVLCLKELVEKDRPLHDWLCRLLANGNLTNKKVLERLRDLGEHFDFRDFEIFPHDFECDDYPTTSRQQRARIECCSITATCGSDVDLEGMEAWEADATTEEDKDKDEEDDDTTYDEEDTADKSEEDDKSDGYEDIEDQDEEEDFGLALLFEPEQHQECKRVYDEKTMEEFFSGQSPPFHSVQVSMCKKQFEEILNSPEPLKAFQKLLLD